MSEIVVFLLIIILSAGVGKKLIKLENNNNKLEEVIFSISLGLAFFSYLTLLLGSLKLLYSQIFLGILLILFIILLKEILSLFRILLEKLMGIIEGKYSIGQYTIFILLLAFCIVNFILCFSPSLIWDELYYHLVIPQFFIKNHKIVYIPYIPHSNFPQFTEMLYTFGMMLSSDLICNLLHYLFGILCLLSIYSFSRKYANSNNLLSSLIFISIPVVNSFITSSYIDLSTCLYTFLAIYCLMNYIRDNDKKFFILSSIFAGFSAATKYSGLVVIIIMCLIYICMSYHPIKQMRSNASLHFVWLSDSLIKVFLYLLIAILIASPFYLKNQIIAGNPFYPFLYNIFGGRDLTDNLAKDITASITSFGGMGKDIKQFFLLPYNLVVYKEKFYGDITSLYLIFLPIIIFFLPKFNIYLKYSLLFAFLYLIYWFLSTQQARFLLPVILILTIIIVFIINSIYQFNKYIGGIIYIGIFVFSFYYFYEFTTSYSNRLCAAVGMIKKEKYIDSYYPPYLVFKFINQRLDNNAKIYFANDNRVYYCDREFIIPDFVMLKRFKEKERYKMLKQLGATHLFINLNLCKFDEELCKIITYDWINNKIKLIHKRNNVLLFAINYKI